MSNENSNVRAAIELTERLTGAEYVEEAELVDAALAVIPGGKQVIDLRKFQDARLAKPRRLEGTSKHTTLDSLIEHVNRFKDARSAVFAVDEPSAASLAVVYDYHLGPSDPRFAKHRAEYAFPFSDDWKAWTALAARGYVSQAELATFLEDHIADVLPIEEAQAPTHAKAKAAGLDLGGPSALSGLARNLSVNVSAEVTQATTLASGEGQLIFKESHTTSVKVPSGFALSIPVFRGGLAVDVLVRLRYRAGGGKVAFAVVLHDVDRLFRFEFGKACERVAEKTALPIFFGQPE